MAKGMKTGGRAKGAPNKDTAEIRQNFQLLIENNLATLENDLKALTPKERIKAVLDLSRFVLPTLKSTDLNFSENNNNINPILITFDNDLINQ